MEDKATNAATAAAYNKDLDQRLELAIDGLDVVSAERPLAGEMSIRDLRRSRFQGADDKIGMLTLTEVDDLLVWEYGTGVASPVDLAGRRRLGSPAAAPAGTIVKQLKFRKLEPNQVGEFLGKLDDKCAAKGEAGSPIYGLRKWQPGTRDLLPIGSEGEINEGPMLLLIHGTFSNCDHVLGEILATPKGTLFLNRAAAKYTGGILTFDHPTFSVSPVLNALDLARLLPRRKGMIDVICHSRGGLVARWWLEAFGGAQQAEARAVFVGSPLRGTGLAAPDRLRSALALLTNFGKVLGAGMSTASLAVPMLSVAVGIQKIVTSIANVGAKTPLLDAAIAMVPGLSAQSAASNNAELKRLRTRCSEAMPEYFAVLSNFEPKNPDWKFWKCFRKLPMHLANLAVDTVFDAANDLVVDTSSMASFYGFDQESKVDLPESSVYSFGSSETVHHLNYFRQQETIDSLKHWLEVS
jgi:pimeloyl-ACP methyl ester carboxylesterase